MESDDPTDLQDVERATCELAANMIRVIRGAGKPFELYDGLLRLQDIIGRTPTGTNVLQVTEAMVAALRTGLDDQPGDNFDSCIHDMERGALRMVAARLLGQPLQIAAGERELWDGFYQLERLREESSKKWAASSPKPISKRRKTARVEAVKKMIAATIPDDPPERPKSTAEAMRLRRNELRK